MTSQEELGTRCAIVPTGEETERRSHEVRRRCLAGKGPPCIQHVHPSATALVLGTGSGFLSGYEVWDKLLDSGTSQETD